MLQEIELTELSYVECLDSKLDVPLLLLSAASHGLEEGERFRGRTEDGQWEESVQACVYLRSQGVLGYRTS